MPEGAHSAGPIAAFAERLGVELPIAPLVDQILSCGAHPDQKSAETLALPFGVERAVVPWLRRKHADK